MLNDWLVQYTGQGSHFWMARVQRLIELHTSPTDDPHHGSTDSVVAFSAVFAELLQALQTSFPVTGEPYDENMRLAACVSMVTTLWFSRVQLAKISDPKRPLALRRTAYGRLQSYHHALLAGMMDTSQDAAYFPTQQWQSPFTFDSSSGTFV